LGIIMSSLQTQEYALATTQWKSTANIVVQLQSGLSIAHFPLEFLRHGGDHSWTYILYVLKELLDFNETETWTVINQNAKSIDPSELPIEGYYRLVVEGEDIRR